MKHVTIELSDAEQAFVEAQVAEGKYPDAESCLAAAVRMAARTWAQQRLEKLLLEGLESEELEWTPELREQIRRDAGLTG